MKKLKIYLFACSLILTIGLLSTQKSLGQASGGPVLTLIEIKMPNGSMFYDCQGSPRDCWTGVVIGEQ